MTLRLGIGIPQLQRVSSAESASDYLSSGGNFFPTLLTDGSMFQEISGGTTTPADTASDPVGTIVPQGDGAFAMSANLDARRGVVALNETVVNLDGSDDFYTITAGTRTIDMYVAYIVGSTDTDGVHFSTAADTARWFGHASDGSALDSIAFAGNPVTTKVNGVTVSGSGTNGVPTQDEFHTAAHTGSKVLIEFIGVNLSNAAWSSLQIGQRGGALNRFSGGIGDIVIDVNSASVRDNIPAFLASRHGISL